MKHNVDFLVTGGLGFIGNEVVRQLKGLGSVAIIDSRRRISPDIADISALPVEQIDICDRSAVDSIFERLRPRYVFHLAALHFIPECNSFPALTIRTNVEGTLNVAQAAARSGCARFVFASSGAVYADSEIMLSEESPVKPVDIYGISKLHAEELLRWVAGSSRMPVICCRLFNNYGPRETNAHILPEICAQLRLSNVLSLGNIDTIRDYIHTSDCAEILIKLIETELPVGEAMIVNVSTGVGSSVRELIELIGRILNRRLEIKCDPSRFRKADKKAQTADVTKLKYLANWSPKITLERGLSNLLKYEGLLP
jgi:UDP-glucose 4-epimerase